MNPRRATGSQRPYDPLCNLVFSKSQGEFVWDEQGNQYLDLICGYSACNLGHAHPRITAAATDQLSKLTWAHGGESLERRILEQTLSQLWDAQIGEIPQTERFSKVWLTVSGARANEIAWKLAHEVSPGPAVHFDLAYHGRSLATAFLSDTRRSEAIGNLSEHQLTVSIPFPRHSHGPCGPILQTTESHALCDECQRCLAQAQHVIESGSTPPKILFVEPAIGARGYYFAPAAFFRELTRIARKRNPNGTPTHRSDVHVQSPRMGARPDRTREIPRRWGCADCCSRSRCPLGRCHPTRHRIGNLRRLPARLPTRKRNSRNPATRKSRQRN